MCEYKNIKSEAFTAVISLISLYNSVACHEKHTHTYIHNTNAPHTHTRILSLKWEKKSNGRGHPGHLACKRPKKKKG